MIETAHNSETGEFAVRQPGLGWQVVDQDTYEHARQMAEAGERSLPENLVREIGSQWQDFAGTVTEAAGGGGLIGGGLSVLSGQYSQAQRPGAMQEDLRSAGREIQQANDPQQQARYAQFPGIGAGAMVLDPTNFVPVGGAAKGLGMGRLGSRAGERVVGETTSRVVGAAEQVVARTRGRVAQDAAAQETARARTRRGVGAQANPDAPAAPQERVLAGMLTPDEVDDLANDLDLGKLLTPGDRAALRARVDTDEIQRADAMRSAEELSRSNVVTDRARGGVNEVRDNAANAATRLVMNELGEGAAFRLTAENMGKLVEQSQQVFEKAAREAGDIPIANRRYAELQDIADDVGTDDANVIQRYIDNITKDAKDHADVLPNKLVRDYRTKVGRAAQRAAAGDNFERSLALRDVQEWLDKLVDERVSGETREALAEARYRWRIIRALEGSTASTDAGGKVNLPSFVRSYQRGGNRFFKSTGKEESRGRDFSRALETLRFLTAKVEPDSGTAGRVLHNLAGRVPFSGR
ncbi:hypothetical protein [Qingshengfaniella alkalisoli]|uniref:Uncharacterized protein n=1 Tax=Qingshengfaniella alkalisoli TaxID=2599296 RepID=A0A5B8IA96_9RHOB|nr:hypothetical protein [Qingshengfaniella alkalisoli]QDY70136.1 hypothetical protein FPZ52_11220 [Qingshengfaniella alkalisoli]